MMQLKEPYSLDSGEEVFMLIPAPGRLFRHQLCTLAGSLGGSKAAHLSTLNGFTKSRRSIGRVWCSCPQGTVNSQTQRHPKFSAQHPESKLSTRRSSNSLGATSRLPVHTPRPIYSSKNGAPEEGEERARAASKAASNHKKVLPPPQGCEARSRQTCSPLPSVAGSLALA